MLKTMEKPKKSILKTHRNIPRIAVNSFLIVMLTLVLTLQIVSAAEWGAEGLGVGLVAYWEFQDDGVDQTGENDLTGVNTPGFANGIIGQGTDLDSGGPDYWDGDAHKSTLNIKGDQTINLWMNNPGLGDREYILNSLEDSESKVHYRISWENAANLQFDIEGRTLLTIPVSLGRWIMVTATSNTTGMYVFINGTFYSKHEVARVDSLVASDFYIGTGWFAGAVNKPFDGLVDEFGMWNRTLTPTEIDNLYADGSGLAFGAGTPSLNKIVVNLTNPIDGKSFEVNEIPKIFRVNHTSVSFTLINTTYNIWFINHTILNQTTYLINSSNITNPGFIIPFGTFRWNAYTCGENTTSTLCVWQSQNWTFDAGASIDSILFPNNVSETERAVFTLNISLIEGANLFAARLNYNGTRYLATKSSTGNGQFLTRIIDIPLLDSLTAINVSFHWEFEYKNGIQGNQNSSTYSHRVNPLIFQECNATHPTRTVLNITVANETTRQFIDSNLDGSFDFWLGSGTVTKGYSLDTATGTTKGNYTFCANRENVNVSAVINIKSTGYFERTFYFNKENYNSSRTNTTLFLQTKGDPIIIQMTDSGLVALVGKFINVYRYYPDIDDYLIVEKARSDEFGQFVARLIEPNTVKYQFEFLDEDNNVLKRTDDITIACRTTFCVIPFVIEGDFNDFDRFVNITDFDYSISFSNTTNTFTYTWNDVTGESIRSRLLVQRVLFNGTSTVCNSTSTSSANTITCDVGDQKAKYRAQGFRRVDGKNEQRVVVLNIEVGSTVLIFGLEGLFWAFILLFTLVGVGSFNPTIGVGLYTVGFIALGVLGVISMPIPIFFANLILGILFIWAIRT